jgi:hypothetical protein
MEARKRKRERERERERETPFRCASQKGQRGQPLLTNGISTTVSSKKCE